MNRDGTFVKFSRGDEVVAWWRYSHLSRDTPMYTLLWESSGKGCQQPIALVSHEYAGRKGLVREDFIEEPDELLVLLAKTALLS